MAAGRVPLWAPLYGAGPLAAVGRLRTKYARFDGRANRGEFWWWALLTGAVTLAAVLLGGVALLVLALWWAATIVPSAALAVRRLHDVDLRGWYALLVLIPTAGLLVVLVLAALPSSPRGARFDRPDAEEPGYIPRVPGPDLPPRDYGWPPLPLPYASPAGGQPLFADPPEEADPR